MERFLSPEPEVRLVKAFPDPFKNAVATAQTCYSSKGIVEDEAVTPRFEELARDLYRAGHHTTFQHAHFQFAIGNVSRQFIWSFLHSHPFYNSEQVSQRYVAVKPDRVAVPPLEAGARQVYLETVHYQMAVYHRLVERLTPLVDAEYARRFPRRRKHFQRDVQRKAQEVARYVVPVAALSYLYHTVSGLTLLRYHRLCQQADVPLEQRIVVEKMVAEVLRVDPHYRSILEDPLPLEATPEYRFFAAHQETLTQQARRGFLEEFDRELGGWTSRLVDCKSCNEPVLAQAVREVLGVERARLSDEDAIRLVLDPARNPLLGESLNLTTLDKLSRTLVHPAYTFRKKLSHTADSQDQRHRMTPASRPVLLAHFTGEPDYITPELIRRDEAVRSLYDEAMAVVWEGMNALRRLGTREEFVLYLLPNAAAIRFTESADLLNLRHKHAMRLCYNAQEEIWRASLEEALQVREANPLIGQFLLPPCTLRHRAGIRPVCPEGVRYCGVKVWRLQQHEYERVI